MQPKEKRWYLGPAGALQELTCPEPSVSTPLIRYGGVHQGLSGARTMDVTGHRYDYEFNYTYLEKSEWAWLKAMHARIIPGPFRLINPMEKNRLTVQTSGMKSVHKSATNGVSLENATDYTMVRDWPVSAGPGTHSYQLNSFTIDSIIRFDSKTRVAVLPEETVTFSIYAKATTADQTFLIGGYNYDADRVYLGVVGIEITATTSWQRFSYTTTAPAGGAMFEPIVWTNPQTSVLRFAAPQLESGAVATPWESGGGSAVVLVDQLATSSPRFPLTDCKLTLLEA